MTYGQHQAPPPGPQAGYAAPGPPPKKSNTALIVVLAIIGVVVLSCGGIGLFYAFAAKRGVDEANKAMEDAVEEVEKEAERRADERKKAAASSPRPVAPMPEQWVSAGDGFQAMFPLEPTTKVSQVPFEGGSAKQVIYTAEVGRAFFKVTTSDYQLPTIPTTATVKPLLQDQALESLALAKTTLGGTEISKGWVKQGTHDAYEFQMLVQRPHPGTQHWRFLFIGRRMYQLVAQVPLGGEAQHKDRFFRDFKPGPPR